MAFTSLPTYPAAVELPPQALADFRSLGVIRLSGAIDPDHIGRCRDAIWRALATSDGVSRDDPSTWSRICPTLVKPLAAQPDFALPSQPRVRSAIDRLLGTGWRVPKSGGSFFMSPPTPTDTAWTLPRGGWHWDGRPDLSGRPAQDGSGGLWIFTPLAPLATRQGGTLLIAGSHRLVRQFYADLPASELHAPTKRQKPRFFKRHPWLALLQQMPSEDEARVAMMAERPFIVDGQELRIVDVHGEPGDVVLMASEMIHTSPGYVGPGPRMLHVCVVDQDGCGEGKTK